MAFTTGIHRPIYLWGGPGTIRMNRLKFLNAPVDEQTHQEAHCLAGAKRVVKETGCNWVYLSYNWGFPPEIEKEDWLSFEQAARIYHNLNAKVFAYIQTSNCVYQGSYLEKDWYARDPQGRKIYYYSGRYMVCWNHPEWFKHLQSMIEGAIQRGADGIFFDNLWYGSQPFSFGGCWLGPVGCYCPTCQKLVQAQTNYPIPKSIFPGGQLSDQYIRWRATRVTQFMARLAEYAKSINPQITISANNFDAIMRPSYLIYGIDLEELSWIQDVIMIEDYGLPFWEAKSRSRLVNNALTLRTARSLVRKTSISVNPYDKGIGFDSVYSSRRYQQAIAEAAACGAINVIKGTEFIEERTFTLLTAGAYSETRQEIGRYHRWLEDHSDLYQDRRNVASVALLYPGENLWRDWFRTAPLFFGAALTLLIAGIPWKVLQPDDSLEGIQVLLMIDHPDYLQANSSSNLKVINIPSVPGWNYLRHSFLHETPILQPVFATLIDRTSRLYFKRKIARQIFDQLGIMKLFTRSSLFNLPPKSSRQNLLDAFPIAVYPRVLSQEPVLIEVWQKDTQLQVHLLNYNNSPQKVCLEFPATFSGKIITPDGPAALDWTGSRIELLMDIYSVLLLEKTD